MEVEGERRSLPWGTDTPLLLPVPCREPATWCPRTSPSLPSPCSAASLRMSLSRSCPGCAWCFQLPARAGCLLHGSALLLLGCATKRGPGRWWDSAQPGRTAAGASGVEGGCLRAGGEESPGLPPCWALQLPPRCGFLSPPVCLCRQLLPSGLGAVPATSPLHCSLCTHVAPGGL